MTANGAKRTSLSGLDGEVTNRIKTYDMIFDAGDFSPGSCRQRCRKNRCNLVDELVAARLPRNSGQTKKLWEAETWVLDWCLRKLGG